MRLSTLHRLLPFAVCAGLVGCFVQTAPQDTVLVNRWQPPLPPPDDQHQVTAQSVLGDPLPDDAVVVQTGLPPAQGITVRAAPGLTPQVVAVWQRSDLVPFQSWIELPGSVVGMIWMAGPQAWGAGYEHSATPSQQASRDEYKFGVDGTSPYAVYFQSDGRGFNFLRGWSGGGRGVFDAAMFSATTPNPWGLSRRAHIVEVDVNARQGAPAGPHFVVTGARVLDGTSAYPPLADEVLIALRQRFDAVLGDERPELEGLYSSGVRSIGAPYAFGPPTAEPVGVFPTWRRDAGAIEVVFTSGARGEGRGATTTQAADCPHCPLGAPCMRCDPRPLDVTQTATVKVGYAIRYRVDARGLIVAETRYAGRLETSRAEARNGGRNGGDY